MSQAEPRRYDVQQLMQEVKERARRARSSSEAVLEAGSRNLTTLGTHFDLLSVPLASPRPGVGSLISGAKRILNRLLTPVFHRQTVFNAALVNLVGEVLAHETRLANEIARLEERLAAIDEQIGQHVENMTGRIARLERRIAHTGPPPAAAAAAPAQPATGERDLRADYLDGWDRYRLHQRFRGSETEIRARQQMYIEYFKGNGPVLDIGCGRGEFLELLRDAGVAARGVDSDVDSILYCREKGLDVVHGDAFAQLDQIADDSLGGIFSAQFIEHFPPPEVMRLVHFSARKLRRHGVVVYETPNPQCLTIFAQAFYLDFSHVWPYHPEIMKAVLESAGFTEVQTVFSSPVDATARLPEVDDPAVFGPGTEAYNRAVKLLNGLLLGAQDYAVIGRKWSDTA